MRMKNFLKKAGMIVMASAMILLNACAQVNIDTGNKVCEYLEKQYGCKFIATHIGDRLDKSSSTLFVHPESNNDMVFTAIMAKDGQVTEDYVPNLVLYKVETAIQDAAISNNMECSANAVFTEGWIIEKNPDISVTEFMSKHEIDNVFMDVIFKESSLDAHGILDAFENASRICGGINFTIYAYILPSSTYQKCKTDFATYPSVSETEIMSYEPIATFSTLIRDGKSSLTVEELSNILEG